MPEFIDLREPKWLADPNKDRQAQIFSTAYQNAQINKRLEREIEYKTRSSALEEIARGLEIQKSLRGQQILLKKMEAQPALGEVYEQITRLPGDWADPAADDIIGQYVIKHPEGTDLPLFKVIESNQEKALARAARLPANAADEAAITNQLAREEAVAFSKTGQPWTPEQRATRAAELGALKDFKPAFKGGITFDDQGRIQQVSFGDQPTVATASFVQKNLNTAEKNMQLLNELSANLRGKDLGVRGNLGEIADRWAPQLGIAGFDKTRATNRESLKVAIQGMVRQISSDTGRFSEGDRKRAEAAMVSPGWDENEQHARAVLDELRDIVRNRAKIDAATAGIPAPEWTLSSDDIIDAVQSGKMTREKGTELRLKYHRDKFRPQ